MITRQTVQIRGLECFMGYAMVIEVRVEHPFDDLDRRQFLEDLEREIVFTMPGTRHRSSKFPRCEVMLVKGVPAWAVAMVVAHVKCDDRMVIAVHEPALSGYVVCYRYLNEDGGPCPGKFALGSVIPESDVTIQERR